MIPHKSRLYRAILDLSYRLKLSLEEVLKPVNKSTTKTAPRGAIDQLGYSLSRITHTFTEVNDDVKVFMAKWDIKDGFWRLGCEAGEEYTFAYVLPRKEGMPTKLVIPTSLQMGWIESPHIFGRRQRRGETWPNNIPSGQRAPYPSTSLRHVWHRGRTFIACQRSCAAGDYNIC